MRGWLVTALIAALMLVMLWRRFRFLGRRRRLRPRGMWLRIGIGTLLGGTMLFRPWVSLPLACGALVLGGLLASRPVLTTDFERGERGMTFRSTSRIGTVVFAVFAARMLWRLIDRVATGQPLGPRRLAAGAAPPDHMPLTLVLLFVMLGYSLYYTTGVLIRSRRA